MAVDPLSPATRATKRNLLVASVLAITYRAFDVTINTIPIAGLSIAFDRRLFAFLLIVTLFYFTTTFSLYYFIDIRNLEKTPHRKEREEAYQLAINGFWSHHAAKVMRRLQRALPDDVKLNLNDGTLAKTFQEIQHGQFDFDNSIPRYFAVYRGELNNAPVMLKRDTDAHIFATIDKHIDSACRSYRRKQTWHRRRSKFLLYAVRALYFIRDYLLDGILPLLLALLAFATLLRWIDLQGLRELVPTP
jgi:hypothetical protein